MLKYIYRDMMSAMRYLPYGVAVGVPAAVLFVAAVNYRRKKEKKAPLAWLPATAYCVYVVIMLAITFLSREAGSRKGMDMELFSTWGINKRNNAFVIENILLFIPYGFLSGWNFNWAKKFWKCILAGALTSFGIEFLQLVTGRGYFQIDDILTNILGTTAGFFAFKIVNGICSYIRKRRGRER